MWSSWPRTIATPEALRLVTDPWARSSDHGPCSSTPPRKPDVCCILTKPPDPEMTSVLKEPLGPTTRASERTTTSLRNGGIPRARRAAASTFSAGSGGSCASRGPEQPDHVAIRMTDTFSQKRTAGSLKLRPPKCMVRTGVR